MDGHLILQRVLPEWRAALPAQFAGKVDRFLLERQDGIIRLINLQIVERRLQQTATGAVAEVPELQEDEDAVDSPSEDLPDDLSEDDEFVMHIVPILQQDPARVDAFFQLGHGLVSDISHVVIPPNFDDESYIYLSSFLERMAREPEYRDEILAKVRVALDGFDFFPFGTVPALEPSRHVSTLKAGPYSLNRRDAAIAARDNKRAARTPPPSRSKVQ